MKDKLLTMLRLQDQLNQTVHPEWRSQGFKWTRAIMVEGVEALEHYGWKWWKKQEPDLPQVRIELVDIWHFIMSHTMEQYPGAQQQADVRLAYLMENGPPGYLVEGDPRTCLELLISRAAGGEIHVNAFLALMAHTGMSFDDLYRLYIGKNVLNMFRQANGYKAGTYIKMWGGEEDNVVLDRLLTLRPDATPGELTNRLGQLYNKVTVPTFDENEE